MNDKPFFFTLPLDPQWRRIIEKDPRSGLSKITHPHSLLIYKHILNHECTKEALIHLTKTSRTGLSLDYINKIITLCRFHVSRLDFNEYGYKRAPWMSNRKELKRMADETREIRKRLSKWMEDMERWNPQIYGNPNFQRHRVISIQVDAYMKKDVRFSDIDILESLDAVADFWDGQSKPHITHRPREWDIELLLCGLEKRFRNKFSRPLIPVIALLAQVVSDTIQTLKGKDPGKKWTPARVTTRLKRSSLSSKLPVTFLGE